MSAEVHETILSFCIENNIPQNKAVALLRDIVEDMNGDGDNYDFSFVATAYAVSKNAAQQSVQPTLLESPRSESHSCACPLCKGSHTTLPQSG